jgi:hypothetical protein
MVLTTVAKGTLYVTEIDDHGEPTILAHGRPVEIPKGVYQQGLSAPQIEDPFHCPRCQAQVISACYEAGEIWQACKCWIIKYLRPDESGVCANAEAWKSLRETYERESLDPAPLDGSDKEALEYCQRKLGFKRPIKVSQGGKLVKTSGGSSVYVDPDFSTARGPGIISLQLEEPEEGNLREHLDDAMRALLIKSGGVAVPMVIIVSEGMIFPPGTVRVEPRPFKCPHCQARVQQGHIEGSQVDRMLIYDCMAIILRRDTPDIRSAKEWQAARDDWAKGQVHHRAATTDGKS